MKNILNKLGYMSRPAMIGVALGVATVAVGIGIVTNFSGGSKGSKGFSGSALQQYAGSMGSSAASRESIEARMAAAEAARANSVGTLRDAASKEQFGYGKGSGAGAGSVAGMGNAAGEGYSGEGYGQGSLDSKNAEGDGIDAISQGMVAYDDPAAQAAAEAAEQEKLAAAEAEAAKLAAARGQLRTSSMASGSSVKGGSGAKGSSGASMSLPGSGRGDSSATKVPQGKAGDLGNVDADAFKSGRLGAMGGLNASGRGRGDGLGSGQQGAFGSNSSLARAYNQSKKSGVDYTMGAKKTADSAFDGSVDEPVLELTGDTPQQAALNALEKSTNQNMDKSGLAKVDNTAKQMKKEQENADKLKKKMKNKIWTMLGVATAAGLAAFFMFRAGQPMLSNPFTAAAGIALIAGAAVIVAGAILAMGLMAGDIASMCKEIEAQKYVNDAGAYEMLGWMSFGILSAMTVAAMFAGAGKLATVATQILKYAAMLGLPLLASSLLGG